MGSGSGACDAASLATSPSAFFPRPHLPLYFRPLFIASPWRPQARQRAAENPQGRPERVHRQGGWLWPMLTGWPAGADVDVDRLGSGRLVMPAIVCSRQAWWSGRARLPLLLCCADPCGPPCCLLVCATHTGVRLWPEPASGLGRIARQVGSWLPPCGLQKAQAAVAGRRSARLAILPSAVPDPCHPACLQLMIMLRSRPVLPSAPPARALSVRPVPPLLRSVGGAWGGTAAYTAPETYAYGRLVKASDVFAFGIMRECCGTRLRVCWRQAVPGWTAGPRHARSHLLLARRASPTPCLSIPLSCVPAVWEMFYCRDPYEGLMEGQILLGVSGACALGGAGDGRRLYHQNACWTGRLSQFPIILCLCTPPPLPSPNSHPPWPPHACIGFAASHARRWHAAPRVRGRLP